MNHKRWKSHRRIVSDTRKGSHETFGAKKVAGITTGEHAIYREGKTNLAHAAVERERKREKCETPKNKPRYPCTRRREGGTARQTHTLLASRIQRVVGPNCCYSLPPPKNILLLKGRWGFDNTPLGHLLPLVNAQNKVCHKEELQGKKRSARDQVGPGV